MIGTIKLRVRKEMDNANEFKVLKLKETLTTRRITEIIHVVDEDEDFCLNSFCHFRQHNQEAEGFVLKYISDHDPVDVFTLLTS